MKLADSVLHRVVQCIQEGMLTGTDVSDSLRQITLCQDNTDPHVLVLTPEYEEQVKTMHEKMLAEAQKLADKRSATEEPQIIGIGINLNNDKGSN